jgi:hypothetical protein
MDITHIKGEEEGFNSSIIIEDPLIPTQTISYVKSMTPCASP